MMKLSEFINTYYNKDNIPKLAKYLNLTEAQLNDILIGKSFPTHDVIIRLSTINYVNEEVNVELRRLFRGTKLANEIINMVNNNEIDNFYLQQFVTKSKYGQHR